MLRRTTFILPKLFLAMALILSVSAYAQKPIVETEDSMPPYVLDTIAPNQIDTIWSFVNKKAEFSGGQKAFRKWLSEHIKYPLVAQEQGIQGKVFVRFIVRYDGSIDKIEIARSVHSILDNEAIRLVKLMPNWTPARKNRKQVSSLFTLPVTFILQNHFSL